jgi:hypothetical protein
LFTSLGHLTEKFGTKYAFPDWKTAREIMQIQITRINGIDGLRSRSATRKSSCLRVKERKSMGSSNTRQPLSISCGGTKVSVSA